MGFLSRFGALVLKEFRQARRDRRIVFVAIGAPTIQLLVFGFVLSATVTNLPLGVVNESAAPESRELIAALTESKSFRLGGYYSSVADLSAAISRGELDAGVVIPYDYARNLQRGLPVTVQFFINATNANTAAIGQGYVAGVLGSYASQLAMSGIHVRRAVPSTVRPIAARGLVVMRTDFLYNPGLVGSWFMVTGILGMLLILNGSLLSSTMMVKERSAGTIEQLLMSPATTTEIIIAKITPLFTLLLIMGTIALIAIRFVFGVPFQGSALVVFAGSILCMLSGIGLGMLVATLTKTAQQAQLSVFFLNPPLASLSGAFTPIQAMPKWLQPATLLNPIAYFAAIARGALIKGSGIDVLWPDFLGLGLFTLVVVSISVWRYRSQLG
ncbi:MAG TPA: ABC transporter permease [Candidatus Tumulicola sp.]|nr:ABC transporter permease [Candidatus Tumulicola sp.]